jgi:hypothetical protein
MAAWMAELMVFLKAAQKGSMTVAHWASLRAYKRVAQMAGPMVV